ncbi:MAG: penicillin acylase family protein [Dokdonella sp.]
MRWLRRIVVVLLCAAALAVLSAWLCLRGSLPRLDGQIEARALSAAASVERDALGTVTIRAQNRNDIAWTLGYVHAQERFFEMDLMRRRAAGELAELFGAAAVPLDRKARVHRMRTRAEAAMEQLNAADRAQIDAYRDGVNRGLADLSVRAFPYLLTGNVPVPWRSEGSLLVVDAMFFALNDGDNARELAFARMHAALPESAHRFLTASGGELDAPISGDPLQWPDPPTPDELDLRALDPALLKPAKPGSEKIPGSNGFAVGGAVTGGAAIVANDMHLDLRVPNIWFRARLIYPEAISPTSGDTVRNIDISGASLPGTPAIVAGSNGYVAWGFTNSYIDTADWVRVDVDPADAARYRTPDGWQPIVVQHETIRVHGAPDEKFDVRETRWGPIMAADVDGTPLALAWTAQQVGGVDLNLLRLERAHDATEAMDVAQHTGMPPQNFVVGDSAGNVGWTISGQIPRRSGGYDPLRPSDWSVANIGWNGWLPAGEHPAVINPVDARIWTANQRVVGDSALTLIRDGGYDLGARAAAIRNDLRERDHFNPADMLAIQLDDRAVFLTRWKDLLANELERAPVSPLRDRLRAALADWNGRADIDSVGYRVVRAWRSEVTDSVLSGFAAAVRKRFPDFMLPRMTQAEQAVWILIQQRPAHLLPPGTKNWDSLLIDAALRVGEKLDAQPGGMSARSWGERNTIQIRHPLSRALPGFLARLLDMPAEPLPGDSNLPRVQGPDFGASERFAVAPGDEEHGYFMMPGGQSGHPLSPYYGAGHADWTRGKPTPFLPGPAQHTLLLAPVQ